VDQTGTPPTDPSPQAQDEIPPTPPAGTAPSSESAGFQPRGRARRRARFLRKARELAYRDLGGLVFNLHRFGQRNDALVLAKLTTLAQIDAELRTIEGALGERRPITVLREAGITACPRCAAIHSSEDSFCPNCGLAMDRHADLPIAGAAAPPAPASAPQPPPAATGSAPAPQPPPAAMGSAPAPQPPPAAMGSAPAPQPVPSAPAQTPPAQPAPAAPDPAREPVPATSPTGRSPVPPATDRPTEILRPPVSSS
jgi:hypothetical protein